MSSLEQGLDSDKMELRELVKNAKIASKEMALLSNEERNACLNEIVNSLNKHKDELIKANELDLKNGKNNGLNEGMLDRLMLNEQRIADLCIGINQVSTLADPLNHILMEEKRPSGIHIKQLSVPLGLVAMIYESRPNVSVDAASLCIKSGNAVVLRGGKEAIETNKYLVSCIQEALTKCGIDKKAVSLIEDLSHERVNELMKMNDLVDVLIPRGGKRLIDSVVANSTVPIIQTGTGNNSIYVDESANLEEALKIIENAKCQRISVCNAIENLLVHESIAEAFLPKIVEQLKVYPMQYCGNDKASEIIHCELATQEELSNEFLDYKCAILVVSGIDEALDFIERYGTKHSEAIIATDKEVIQKFFDQVDASALYVNTSTRFSDGFEFGLGCEIGISTQKLHARGPMGLEALTTIKYLIDSDYVIR